MPTSLGWYIPYRVIETSGSGEQTAADIDYHAAELLRLFTEAQENAPGQRVYVVHDTTQIESYPLVYLMLPRAVPVLRCQNRGPLYLITQSRTVQSIVALASHIMDFQLRVFATHEAALEALEVTLAKEDLRLRR